jgi:hypothetical protein
MAQKATAPTVSNQNQALSWVTSSRPTDLPDVPAKGLRK